MLRYASRRPQPSIWRKTTRSPWSKPVQIIKYHCQRTGILYAGCETAETRMRTRIGSDARKAWTTRRKRVTVKPAAVMVRI